MPKRESKNNPFVLITRAHYTYDNIEAIKEDQRSNFNVMGTERQPSVTRGGRASEKRRGRVGDLDVGEARNGDALGMGAAPPDLTTTTTSTSTTSATKHTDLGTYFTSAFTTRILTANQSIETTESRQAPLRDQAEEGSDAILDTKKPSIIKQEDNIHSAPSRLFDTPTPNPTPPRIRIRLTNTPGGTSQSPISRLSPEPHPQPKRYRLKFTKHVLDKAQAKQSKQREHIEKLLQRQLDDAVCVSTLVRKRDLEIMPSLEGPLSLRSGRPRGSVEPSAGRVEKEKTVNGSRHGSIGLEREKDRVVRIAGRRVRDKESTMNGDTIHLESSLAPPQQVNPVITITEAPKPPRPKKMELELRIDDNFNGKVKDKETLERNIDEVIFGEIKFKAWYPSWYPKEIIGEKALTVGAGDKGGVVVNELYCEREVPGKKVYVHGGWREDDAPRPAVGEWSIWEVDGGVETLFCQNLSLFAKLFLDNKSVFFDVSGFNYFLLVYTPPQNSPHNLTSPSPSSQSPQKQIIGFFSKEKLSWDNNNLACILIFPPWQRKGLGALLMGISYAVARREQILGGPEKPISALGRKGYKRFWGAEIARWILERPERRGRKGKGGWKVVREEVGIRLLSEETWIAPEDCLGVLREMGVVERVEARKRGSDGLDSGRGWEGGVEGEEKERVKVRIDKEAVRRWCEREKIKLERVVTEEGFSPGYAEKVDEIDMDIQEEGGEVEGQEGDEEMVD
ncbi:uncharacterized protein RAG0_09003 [Rhynchosporium agropyri]|uniref:histone acetyltransferase n=1 Tax=Rhynchosporium agropyri TaxID=914238 RepID=A0A1E1KT98_9HELO|nr:uncharacterized protein RAG0_09003 [Rhynchosporium agropyri]